MDITSMAGLCKSLGLLLLSATNHNRYAKGAAMIEDAFFVLYTLLGFIVLIWLSYGTAKLIRWVLFRKEEKKWQ